MRAGRLVWTALAIAVDYKAYDMSKVPFLLNPVDNLCICLPRNRLAIGGAGGKMVGSGMTKSCVYVVWRRQADLTSATRV